MLTRSGGEHVYFAYDGKPQIRNSEGKYGLAPGADIRGDGGWVVLPCRDTSSSGPTVAFQRSTIASFIATTDGKGR